MFRNNGVENEENERDERKMQVHICLQWGGGVIQLGMIRVCDYGLCDDEFILK